MDYRARGRYYGADSNLPCVFPAAATFFIQGSVSCSPPIFNDCLLDT